MTFLKTWLGLTEKSENILSVGISVFIGCVGIKLIRAQNVKLQVAGSQLVTSSSASKLEQLARELEQQTMLIQQKDEAYQRLQLTYSDYLHNRRGDIELGEAIEAIDKIPDADNLDEIQSEIDETEESLLEVIGDR
ncbi:MAG: hypothetical protein AAFQ41_03085 [Cyanobacteria bacterium J06623_7]